MMPRNPRASGLPPFTGPGLLAGMLLLSGCGSAQEGSVVLKAPLDIPSIGAPPKRRDAPAAAPPTGKQAPRKPFTPG
jgi:hypothetical protein